MNKHNRQHRGTYKGRTEQEYNIYIAPLYINNIRHELIARPNESRVLAIDNFLQKYNTDNLQEGIVYTLSTEINYLFREAKCKRLKKLQCIVDSLDRLPYCLSGVWFNRQESASLSH